MLARAAQAYGEAAGQCNLRLEGPIASESLALSSHLLILSSSPPVATARLLWELGWGRRAGVKLLFELCAPKPGVTTRIRLGDASAAGEAACCGSLWDVGAGCRRCTTGIRVMQAEGAAVTLRASTTRCACGAVGRLECSGASATVTSRRGEAGGGCLAGAHARWRGRAP